MPELIPQHAAASLDPEWAHRVDVANGIAIGSEVTSPATDGGSSTSAMVFELEAPGVYDPELQLSSTEVAALKQRIIDNPRLGDLACGHIVAGLYLEDFLPSSDVIRPTDEITPEDEGYAEVVFAQLSGLASVAAMWRTGLAQAVALPEAEWPEGMTPPATFAEAIKEFEARK